MAVHLKSNGQMNIHACFLNRKCFLSLVPNCQSHVSHLLIVTHRHPVFHTGCPSSIKWTAAKSKQHIFRQMYTQNDQVPPKEYNLGSVQKQPVSLRIVNSIPVWHIHEVLQGSSIVLNGNSKLTWVPASLKNNKFFLSSFPMWCCVPLHPLKLFY